MQQLLNCRKGKEAAMSKVYFDISMSLDGFITASGITVDEPMGQDGECLHDWAFGSDPVNRDYLQRSVGQTGAVITGRVTYDASLPWWGADGPTGPARMPVFVVTHSEPATSPEGGVYTFVTDGIESALKQAGGAAGDLNVTIMGGAEIGRQYIAAGLVDELSIHLIPVLLGGGTSMFEGLGDLHRGLEVVDVLSTPTAVHLRFALPQ
jgi:dihydrofolate reductase